MTPAPLVLAAERIFDGARFLTGHALEITAGEITALRPATGAEPLLPGTLAPAFLDLQVNGGGGVLVDGTTDVAALRTLCAAHLRLGSAGVLPTLITDTAEATAQVIAAGIAAAREGVPGFLGLHLEGPHLDPRRKGAHDPMLIRRMEAEDLTRLCEAARALPALMVTLAPESASAEQIAALTAAGAVVSLGHSECSYDNARTALAAGARCATHLFNAMSQIGNRDPGVVGAALHHGSVWAGLIADGIHVHPASLGLALRAKTGPGRIFLVSDSMSQAGTEMTSFELNGRTIYRKDGALRLGDGTLAGADLTLDAAVRYMHQAFGMELGECLRMASLYPAQAIGANGLGTLAPGMPFIWFGDDLRVRTLPA